MYIINLNVFNKCSEDLTTQTKKWTRLTGDMISVGKVRQQYQAARQWYAEQNRKMRNVGIGV